MGRHVRALVLVSGSAPGSMAASLPEAAERAAHRLVKDGINHPVIPNLMESLLAHSRPFPNPHSKLESHTKIQLVSGPLEGSTGVPPVCDALLLGSHGYGFFKDTSVRTAETAMHPSLLCQCHFHKDIRISRQFRNPAAPAQCENPSPAFPPTRSWRPATPRAERLPEGRGRVGE